MSLTKFNQNVNNHQGLPDKPGLSSEELKKLFDKASVDIKEYLNTILTEEVDGIISTLQSTISGNKRNFEGLIEELRNAKVSKSGDTMTGGLLMQGNPIGFGNGGNIYFKEDGFGDKFRILPDFSGGGRDNVLKIQSTTGGAGEDPQNWKDLVYIHADTGEVELAGDIGTKSQIVYDSWHNVILTRSDQSWLTLILYGSNLLKKGNYSIANDFNLVVYGTSYAELTIPRSAIKEIQRRDWGFELVVARSKIQGNVSGELNGVAVVSKSLIIQST